MLLFLDPITKINIQILIILFGKVLDFYSLKQLSKPILEKYNRAGSCNIPNFY
jgi:hypothetical protein